ncbi:hypothetical protein [Streptomyces sp. NPDC002403]
MIGIVVGTLDRLAPPGRQRIPHKDRLSDDARRYAHALDELYGRGRGEGAQDLDGDAAGQGGGQDPSFPTAREWAQELEALFGTDVPEEVLAEAADAGCTDVLAQLDPASARPSVEVLGSVLSLAGGMPEAQLARLHPLVKRLVDELKTRGWPETRASQENLVSAARTVRGELPASSLADPGGVGASQASRPHQPPRHGMTGCR